MTSLYFTLFVIKNTVYKVPRLGERKVYRRMPLEGDCQSFTMNDGERFYVKLVDNESEKLDVEKLSKPSRFLGLCGESYSSLLEQAIQEQLRLQESSSIQGAGVDLKCANIFYIFH